MPDADERAVSTPLNYVLVLGVVALLVAVLFVGTADHVTGQRERAVRTELSAVGQRVAADLASAGRLARTTSSSGTVAATIALPERVAGVQYRVAVSNAGADTYRLTLSTESPDVTVTVRFRSETPVVEGRTGGGTLRIALNEHGKLVVTDA